MASGGPPPAFGFRPPPPNGGGQFQPPPPVGQAPSYDSEGEDGGALSSTINLVTSAANMFFKPPPPPPKDNGPPLPPKGVSPAPIETTTSMLDTPASAFQAPPPVGTPHSHTPQKMTIEGNPQIMIPTIPSLPSQPATPTQFPPPRPSLESTIGFTHLMPQATPPPPPVETSSPLQPKHNWWRSSDVFQSDRSSNVTQAPPVNATPPGSPTPKPPASPGNNTQQLRAAVNAVAAANKFMKAKEQPASPGGAGFQPPPAKVQPASPAGFQPPPPSPGAPQASPLRATVNAVAAANKFMKIGAKAQPASPAGFTPPPPSPGVPQASPLRATVNAVAAANKFMKIGAKAQPASPGAGFTPPPPSPGVPQASPLRATVNAVAAANKFMKIGAKVQTASPGAGFKPPPPSPAPQASPLRATVNAVAAANKFMKIGKEKQPSPKPSSPSKFRGVVNAAVAANKFMETVEPKPEKGDGEAITGTAASNKLPSPAPRAAATGSLGGLSPATRPKQKFATPPPSPKVPSMLTKSPRTPLIANTSPKSAAVSSTGQRTPIRKLNLPTPSPRGTRTLTTPSTHRQLRLPPKLSSSRSTAAGSTKTTTPRAKFRLPPSRKKKTTPEPVVNLKPKVSELSPPATNATPPTTETTMEKSVETTLAESKPTAATPAVEETKEPVVDEPAPKAPEDALPEGWIETIDPTSGKVYYYNTDTQETSWEKPKAKPEAATTSKEETTIETAAGVSEPPKEAKNALPAGWIETTDPTSGKVYYYNADTQETSWEMPMVEAAPATDNTIEVLSELKNKSTGATAISTAATVEEEPKKGEKAAEEWSEVTDPTSGEVYYYNTVTEETSWDRPAAMDQSKTEESKPEAAETQDAKEMSSGESIENTFAELNADFGCVDPPKTNEEEDSAPAVEDVPEEQDATPVAGDVPEEKAAFPDGWTVAVDPASGNTYYYNPTTQETSWELPVSENTEQKEAAKVLDAAPSTDTTMEVLSAISQQPEETTATGEQSPENANDLPPDWEEVVDPNSGDFYYFNSVTNETSWERPNTEAAEGDGSDEEPEGSKELDAEEESEPSVEEIPEETGDLPAGWEELVDPNSGDVYYFNSATNETSWERPGSASDDTDNVPATSEEIPPEESSPAVKENQAEANDLPPDWEEVVDPNSGDAYYFNSVTNETSWERPSVEVAKEDGADKEPAESTELDAEETSESPLEDSTEKASDLPAGWEEVVDPSSGDVYYFNSATNETSWERPNVEAANEDSADEEPMESKELDAEEISEPAVEEIVKESSDLPAGWEEVVDPNSGDVYYFNSVSNETSWERPGAVGAANEDTDKLPTSSEEIEAEESSPAVEETQEVANDMPPDWEEVVDPNSGDVYYFNSITNETSWERPNTEAAKEDDAEEPVESKELDVEETSEPAVEAIVKESSDLPAGWEEVVDPNSGDVYYFNAATNETSWDRPVAEVANEANAKEEPTAPEEIEAEESSPVAEEPSEKSSDLPAGWEEVVDPSSGDVYYFNSATNETSWERPIVEAAKEDGADEEPVESKELDAEETSEPAVEEIVKDSSDLPAGWEEVVDPNSGDVYYFNSVSNETSWDRPVAEAANEDNAEEDSAASEEIEAEESSPDVTEIPKESSDLPAGWEEVVDPNSSDVYYFNSVTNETSWERPVAEAANEDNAAEELTAPEESEAEESSPNAKEIVKESSDLPAGWEEVVDPNSGDVYYFNSETNKTSWERPNVEAANEDSADEEPTAPEEIEAEKSSPDGKEMPEEESSDLPAGWEEVVDPSSGDVYYFNSETNETSWERPNVEAANVDNVEEEPAASKEIEAKESSRAMEEMPEEESSDLPAGWEEVVDPNTEDVYYYNSVTNETSWERPRDEQTDEDSVESESAASDDIQAKETLDSATDEPLEDAAADAKSSDLPDNWTEVMDESTGQTYFYNSLTQETSWERPTQEQAAVEALEDAHDDGSAEENIDSGDNTGTGSDDLKSSELPADWIEAVDETSGQTYYYNTASQETSWEKPLGASNDPVMVADQRIESDEHQEVVVLDDITPPETDASLPPNWIETEDKNGQLYYFNTVTNETSWDRPSIENDDEGAENIEEEVVEPVADTTYGDESENALIENLAEGQEELPADWIKAADETSGQTYYYNTATQETSWEKPSMVADDREEDFDKAEVQEDHVPEVEVEGAKEDTDIGGEDDWTETFDESTGQTYYYNSRTEETTWEKPLVLQKEHDGLEDHSGSDNDADVKPDASVSDNQNPGDEWIETVDDSTGQTYYYNTLTQETSWEKPSSLMKDEENEASENDGDDGDDDEKPSEEPESAENAQEKEEEKLPKNWSKEFDEKTGDEYYYNNETYEISFLKPAAEADADVQDRSHEGMEHSEQEGTEHSEQETNSQQNDVGDQERDDIQGIADETLHGGWTEAVDEGTGQTYYYNTVTGETSWEKPPEKLQADDEDDEDNMDDGADNDIDHAAPTNADNENEVEESTSLPDNWIEAVDESSGQTYYYNTETQETSWERPVSTVQEEGDGIASESEPPTARLKDSAHDDNSNGPTPTENESETRLEENGVASDWEEVFDETSDRVYYYNTVTQETSWEKPSVLVENAATEVGESDIIPPVDSATEEDSVKDQELEVEGTGAVESSDLPEDWIQAIDEGSGETYYYNTVSGETSWEKPSGAQEEDAPDVSDAIDVMIDNPVDANDVAAEEVEYEKNEGDESDALVHQADPQEEILENDNDTLPSDWIEAVDETSGQTYYYNTVTQETSWEKPSPDTPAEDPVDGNGGIQDSMVDESGADVNADEPATKTVEAETIDPEDELPSDWVETVDEATGQVYYLNTATQETSWEKPSISSSDTGEAIVNNEHEVAVDEMIGNDSDEANETESVREKEKQEDYAIPREWIEAVDESSGQTYYYNTVTQETSWEKPKIEGDESALEEDKSEVADEEPVSEQRMGDGAVDVDNTDGVIGNSLDVSQDSLPKGWVEVVDEDSGNVYYYNSETSETSWEKPSMISSEPRSSAHNELDQDDEPEVVPNEEWEIVDEPKDDVVVEDDTKNMDVDLSTHVTNLCDERFDFGILGPLSLSDDEAVLAYIKSKSENTRSPLWGLIDIAARSRGRLRSEDGVADRSSPESSIVKLLLREENGSTPAITPSKQLPSSTPVEDDDDLRMERVQNLLLRGNRVEAVKEAVERKDFATALLVASMCDPETYKFAAKSYAENVFAGGSPMYTIGMLFSGSMQVPTESSSGSFWGIGANELNGTWKKHLAAVISNRTAGWDRVVLSLGDRLREIGAVEGAHFCYMICGCRFTDPLDATTRVSLLGDDHADTSIISLTTNAAIDSFDRTEAYEWAKRRGNKNATIKSFQPFKVIFATTLVDFGFEEQATLFALGIRHCADVTPAKAIDLTGEQWCRVFEDPEALAGAFRALEERLDLSLDEDEDDSEYEKVEGEEQPASEGGAPVVMNANDSYAEENLDPINSTLNITDNDATFVTAASNLMDKPGFQMTPQREAPQTLTAEKKKLATEPTPLQEPDSIEPPKVERMPTMPPPVAPLKEDDSKIDMNGMPSRMPPTPTMRNSESIKEATSTPMAAGPPAAAPAMTPKETIKQPHKAPSTAPSVMMGKKNEPKSDKKKAAPSSTEKPRSGGLLSGFRSMMIKRFNKDAVECTLPDNEEKAYYDEKLKRWVFPGDDLDELAKPMAPPPIMPGGGDSTPAAEPEPKADVSNDPLAAMMAPPSRRPVRRLGGTPTMPPVGGAMPPMAGMPPMMPGMPSPVAGGAPAAPPQFAVFTPAKKEKDPKKDEE